MKLTFEYKNIILERVSKASQIGYQTVSNNVTEKVWNDTIALVFVEYVILKRAVYEATVAKANIA